jgi:large subunit ribosomal protein L21
MYAVIRTGGKQQKVKQGDVIEIELTRQGEHGDSVTFTPLLVVDDDGKTHVGKDLGKATVTAKLVGEHKGEKVHIFKYRAKTGYNRRQGHRQRYTLVEIQGVSLGPGTKTRAKGRAAAETPRPEPAEEVEGAPAVASQEATPVEATASGASAAGPGDPAEPHGAA